MTNLLTQNSKLKKASALNNVRVVNFGIPAYKSNTGKVTCPFAGDCVKYCYARKGSFRWPNTINAYENRLSIARSDNFESMMNSAIMLQNPHYVRVHDSGDYFSKKYIDRWFSIMRSNPNTRFYSYTNSVLLMKQYKDKLPDNFDVIFSTDGKQREHVDKSNDRHAVIFKTIEELEAAGYTSASENDLLATKWYSKNIKVGLIKH
tara:strand:+ start:1426 stop:2040 length:615 start_codon:yes stop_codon:yes gene_type:complete